MYLDNGISSDIVFYKAKRLTVRDDYSHNGLINGLLSESTTVHHKNVHWFFLLMPATIMSQYCKKISCHSLSQVLFIGGFLIVSDKVTMRQENRVSSTHPQKKARKISIERNLVKKNHFPLQNLTGIEHLLILEDPIFSHSW